MIRRDWTTPAGCKRSITVLGKYPDSDGGRIARDAAGVEIHEELRGKCSYYLVFVCVENDPTLYGFTVHLIESDVTDIVIQDIVAKALRDHQFVIQEVYRGY